MKKTLLLALLALLSAVALPGCLEPETSPGDHEPAVVADGAPLTAEQRAALEANPQLQALRQQLASSGETASLDDARAFQHGDKLGIVCPVTGPDGQPGEFSQLTVQQAAGRDATFSLELAPQSSPATGALKDEVLSAGGITCSSWGPWYTLSSYCDWATACWFDDATYLLRERERTCCAPGKCYTETEHTTVRNKCGC